MKTKTNIKRTSISMLLMVLFCIFALLGCSTDELSETSDTSSISQTIAIDVEIHEETFIDQVEHILLNPHEYLGKRIRLEGIYGSERFYIVPIELDGYIHYTLMPADDRHIATDSTGFRVVFRNLIIVPGGTYLGYDFPYGSEGDRVGLVVVWEGEHPDYGSWVEAIGTFERAVITRGEIQTEKHLLHLKSLTVLDERGLEAVVR